MTARPLISEIEAINVVGRVIFAKGWIGEARERAGFIGLPSEEGDLIARRGPRPGRRGGTTIEPCPQDIEAQLDRALGRRVRAEAQRGTAAQWLVDRRIADQQGRGYDRDAIIAALKEDPPRADAAPRRGRAPITGIIAAKMLKDVASGKRTEAEIKDASGKNWRNWYGADPATCKKALKIAF